jgi:protein-ribulosamine 3-kinase
MNFKRNTDYDINKEVEKLLSEKFGQQVTILSSGSLGGGCINHASKIETNVGPFFLKWNANCAEDIFLREAESLQELKKAAGNDMIVPKVYAAKAVNKTPGFLVQEYLPTRYSASGDDEKLGRGLAIIHQFKNDKFGFYHNNYCGDTMQDNTWKTNWAEFFRDNRLGFLLNLIQKERSLPVSEMKIYDKLLQKVPELLPSFSEPALIHGDLWSGNYMITEKGPALIDPASYCADREMEMGIMTMFGGFSSRFYDAYNHVYPLAGDWRDRNQLYQLYHVLNHYFLFGGGYQNQAIRIARYYAGD